MDFAPRVHRLETESAFSVLAEVKALEAKGADIVSFAIGEPDFDTPAHIKEAGIAAIRGNDTHYAPSPGIAPLREAIAQHVGETRGIPVHPEEVVVTPGAKPVMFYTILALVDEGDEVIVPSPGFAIYESVVRFAGGRAVGVPLREERDFRMDVDELGRLVTDRTKLIILNSPHNPTGGMLAREDLVSIARIARERGLWVLSDEIYWRLTYDAVHHSIASLDGMKERTIILDGFSKAYAMTGWRLGYGVMPQELAEVVARMVTNNESCTPPFVQRAGIAALRGPQEPVEEMRSVLRSRRDLVVDLIREIPGVSCRVPQGAFYVFANVTEACRWLGLERAEEFQKALLHEAGVAVLARSAFGRRRADERDEFVRISYATSTERIQEGLGRMRRFIEAKW